MSVFVDNIISSLSNFSILEWLGLFTGIIYVILSAQNKIICWFFGIISCACIAYDDFFGGIKLYSDGVLQLFYVVMGFVGIYQWNNREVSSDIDLNLSKELRNHLQIIFISTLLSIVYGLLMRKWTDTAFPILDAFTTIFSIAATFLLVYRRLSAWIYFVIINIVMSYLYFSRGWELYSLLYAIFTIVALFAVYNWSKISKSKKSYLDQV